MSNRAIALAWWRGMTDEQRLSAINNTGYEMFTKEVKIFKETSLTGRMIEDIYNKVCAKL